MKEKKILFTINGLRYGGMERQLVEIIKELHHIGMHVNLMALNVPGPLSEIISPYLESEIVYLDRRKTHLLSTIYRIWFLLKTMKPDIVHVQDSFSALYMLLPCKALKILFINGAIRHAGVTHGLSYFYEKTLLSLSDIIIANSQAGLDYFKLKKGYVLYNFVDLNRFARSTGRLTDIVMNANFHHLKDYRTFFLAMKMLHEQQRLTTVGVIGDGPTQQNYRQIVMELGLFDLVNFYGSISNVEEILLKYGIGILSSTKKYKEGVSNSILEYMGSGLIAIGSNVGGMPEIISHKVNGLLFEAENPDSLYDAIIYVQDHPEYRNRIAEAAYKSLSERHSPSVNVNKYIEIISNRKELTNES